MVFDELYIVGSIALDDIATPSMSASRLLGGSATYSSVFASQLAPTSIIGIVGNDFPNAGYELFKNHNINTDFLELANGKTFSWGGKYHNDFNFRDTLFTDLGVFESYSPTISFPNRPQTIILLANISPDLQMTIVDQCPSEYLIAEDTMNLWIDIAKEKLLQVIKKADVLFINKEEALSLSEASNLQEAARFLLSIGPSSIIIKLGSDGALYTSIDKTISINVCSNISVLDPTGAGDAFAGGFLGSLVKNGMDIDLALKYGTASAAIAITSFGADQLIHLSLDTINSYIPKIK